MSGGYDIGLSFSGSSSATSGIGDQYVEGNIAGGSKLPIWFLPLTLGAFVVVSLVYLVRQ